MRRITILMLLVCANSNALFGQQLTQYYCYQTDCRSVDGPAYTVWADVDIFGTCDNWQMPYAGSSAFAACAHLLVTAYAYATTSSAWANPGWVMAESGYTDTGNAGYSQTDCYGYNYQSPPWIDPGC
jgi:hypothetical protein